MPHINVERFQNVPHMELGRITEAATYDGGKAVLDGPADNVPHHIEIEVCLLYTSDAADE